MSAQPTWTQRLIDADSMRTIEMLSKVHSRDFNPIYNRPGTFSFVTDIDSPVALAVKEFSTAIMIERDGVPVWSGPVFSIKDSADGSSDTTSVTAMGWYEELNHRFIWSVDEGSLIFTDGTSTGGEIAYAILDRLAMRLLSDGSQAPLRIKPGTNTDTQTRARSYKRGQNVGASITELIDIENGMDISVNPVTKELDTKSPTSFTDRTDVLFGFNTAPHNLVSIGVDLDGTKGVNSYISDGASGIYYEGIDDPDVVHQQGVVMEGQISLSDVYDSTIVQAYSVAELEFYKNGGVTLSIIPKSLAGTRNILRLYEDFFLGDQVYLSADRGRIQYQRQPVRLFGAHYTFDDDGNENLVELQVTAS